MTSGGLVALLLVLLVVALGVTIPVIVGLSRRLSLTRRRLEDTVVARDTLLARDRDLAIHASHRLRTPITALRLSLEDLSVWPQTTPEVAEELGHALVEIDRWGEAVEDVLGDAHGHRLAAARDVDLSTLTAEFVETRTARVKPRTLTHRTRGPVLACVDPSAIDDVLDRLLGHLVTHGSGPITMDVACHPSHLRVRLADTSSRTLPPGVVRPGNPAINDSSLTEAGDIAESLGGYLSVEDRSATRFLLLLPSPPAAEDTADLL